MNGKLALAAAVVAGCTLTGQAFSRGNERRYRLLLETIRATEMLEIRTAGLLEPVGNALANCRSDLFAEIAEVMSADLSPSEAWKRVSGRETRRGGKLDCMGGHERETLDSMFERIGERDRETQRLVLQACIDSLRLIVAECRDRAEKSRKLYGSVGFLTGLSIVVMMI